MHLTNRGLEKRTRKSVSRNIAYYSIYDVNFKLPKGSSNNTAQKPSFAALSTNTNIGITGVREHFIERHMFNL